MNKLSQYENKGNLGSGNYGNVYKVLNKKDNKYYALKEISDFDENTKNEINILSHINHPNIIKYYESFIQNENSFSQKEKLYIVMEYCEKGDLRQLIKDYKDKNKKISQKKIILIILDICEGLKEIHRNNIIHRDLKPENIFISKNFKIKIGDFGISKKFQNPNQYAKTQKGTINYMAPEMIKENPKYNNKVDIWALGCIIYELCTLNYCFDAGGIIGISNQIINVKQEKINLEYYSSDLQNLIDLLLNKDYKERPNIEEVYNKIISMNSNLIELDRSIELLNELIEVKVDEVNEDYGSMYEKNFYKGQKILFAMFYSNDLISEKGKAISEEDKNINPKNINNRIGNKECIASVLDYYGYSVIVVTNYEEAINELCKKDNDKCIYNSLWVISGREVPDLPSNNGDINAPYYVNQFVECAIQFWQNGGSLVLMGKNDPYNFQINLFLKKLVFPERKKLKFKIGGNHPGRKILKADYSGHFDKKQSFNCYNYQVNNVEIPSLGMNLCRLYEGENIAYTIGDIYPFIPFSRDSDGGISSLFYLGLDRGYGLGEGNIFIDCGYSKFFSGMEKIGICRYLQNIGGFIGSAERRFELGGHPRLFRPEPVSFILNKSSSSYYKYPINNLTFRK